MKVTTVLFMISLVKKKQERDAVERVAIPAGTRAMADRRKKWKVSDRYHTFHSLYKLPPSL